MKIRIENGITIISTGLGSDDTKNKHKVKGLTYRESEKKYILAVVVDGIKYHIANFDTIEDAIPVRKEIDNHLEDGTFKEWIKEWKKTKRSRNKYGVAGLVKKNNRYQLTVHHNKKKYYLGSFLDIETAVPLRKEVDEHIENGTFLEWWNDWKENQNK